MAFSSLMNRRKCLLHHLCVVLVLLLLLASTSFAQRGGGKGGGGGGGRRGRLANDVKAQLAEGGGGAGGGGKGKRGAKTQKEALVAWRDYLQPERDYNATLWALTMRKQPQNFFSHYTKVISELFASKNAIVNFVLVGACDGTNDNTIKERFLRYDNWRAVFVEPVSINLRDLTSFLTEQGVMNRSHVIHAAGTDVCPSPTTKIKFPVNHEKNNPNAPHWLRREIGAILTPDELAGKKAPPRNWQIEEVRCVTAADILVDWANATSAAVNAAKSGSGKRRGKKGGEAPAPARRRPHVLKIDAEGHDYQVLMGFLLDSTPVADLPLLISFEAKSIADHFEEAIAHMQKRGYVVSNKGVDGRPTNDGFALLRGDMMFGEKKKRGGGGGEAEEGGEED